METLIKTIGLKKHFSVKGGILHAVDGVDLEIKKGQTLGIVGESGCGKSTLGRLVLRLLEATSGQVLFEGEDILKADKKQMGKLRRQMQIIFQDPYSSLDPRMPVYDLIAEPLRVNKIFNTEAELNDKVMNLMETVGLADRFYDAYPHEMDGGRRQRVGVARALALNPKFIVCDEPVSALDVSIQAQILNLLMDTQEKMDLTYMFITHDLSVVRYISDEIAVLYLGQCVERAPSSELFKNPLHPYTKALFSSITIPRLTDRPPRTIVRGEVSDPINPKPGCRFSPRCDYVKPVCLERDLKLVNQGGGHYVACTLYNK